MTNIPFGYAATIAGYKVIYSKHYDIFFLMQDKKIICKLYEEVLSEESKKELNKIREEFKKNDNNNS